MSALAEMIMFMKAKIGLICFVIIKLDLKKKQSLNDTPYKQINFEHIYNKIQKKNVSQLDNPDDISKHNDFQCSCSFCNKKKLIPFLVNILLFCHLSSFAHPAHL